MAILGIFLMNTQSMILPAESYTNPNWSMVNGDPRATGDFYRSFGGDNADFFTRIAVDIFGPHLNAAAYIFTHLFADVKFISIFSLMFGAGIMLQGERVASRGMSPAVIHYRRMTILFLIALFHAYVIWYGDILTEYALCGMLLFPLRKLYPGLLMSLGVVFIGVGLLFLVAKYSNYTVEDLEHNNLIAPQNFSENPTRQGDWSRTFPLDRIGQFTDELQKEFTFTDGEGLQASLSEPDAFTGIHTRQLYDDNGDIKRDKSGKIETTEDVVYWKDEIRFRTICSLYSQLEEFPKWSFWRCGGCMLVGMALLRWRFFHGAWNKPAYWTIALIGIPCGMAISATGIAFNTYVGEWNDDLLHKFGELFNYIGSFIQAIGYMSVGVLVAIRVVEPAKQGFARIATNCLRYMVIPIRSVGKMALSNYLFQSVVGTTLAYGHRVSDKTQFGFGWYGSIERYKLLGIVVCVWAAQLTFSTIWMSFFRQGPVEWAWHKLAYFGQTFPLRPAEDVARVVPAAEVVTVK